MGGMNEYLQLTTGNRLVDRAFRIALGDYFGNVQPWRGENSVESRSCILAGLDYDKPWTRDAAFNSWFAGSFLTPEVARNTLVGVLTRDEAGLRIGGEYWDAIVWVTAAWNHFLVTGDLDFLATAFEVAVNSLHYFESTELDLRDGLFRGGACFQDGVAGYPDYFADGPTSGIADWVKVHPREKASCGHGLPMKALSTNALYYNAYRLLPNMASVLGVPANPDWAARLERLKAAINRNFWNPDTGTFHYLVDGHDTTDRQEGFGHAFVLLFGIASDEQARSVLQNQYRTAHGIACVWPTYERYATPDGMSFGRHSGVIWPQVNTAWVMAAAEFGRPDLAWNELASLAGKACRDNQFAELYHPLTGEIYGGHQEKWDGSGIVEWLACQRQTWCATGYVRMILSTLFGLSVDASGVRFTPWLPGELSRVSLEGLCYREARITLVVERSEGAPRIEINGEQREKAVVSANAKGRQDVHVMLGFRAL